MNKSKINCPQCKGVFKVEKELTAQEITCPTCQHKFVMPSPEQPAATNKTITQTPAPVNIFTAFRKYGVFSGRANRKEFWGFGIFVLFCHAIILSISLISPSLSCMIFIGLNLLILLPLCAVSVRRYHDIGYSGWWIFINLIPLLGNIFYLTCMCCHSQKSSNKYGGNPNGTRRDFRFPAIAGIIMLLVIYSLFIILTMIVPHYKSAVNHSCLSKLSLIGLALQMYADEHNGFMPTARGRDRMRLLYQGRYFGDFEYGMKDNLCPVANTRYAYIGSNLSQKEDDPTFPVVICYNHHWDNILVCHLDGSVRAYPVYGKSFYNCSHAVKYLLQEVLHLSENPRSILVMDNAAEIDKSRKHRR